MTGVQTCALPICFGSVQQTAKDRLGKDLVIAKSDADQDAIARRVGELMATPLTVDDAVQIALLNNRGLQATYQELGITEAEVVQAGRLPNPGSQELLPAMPPSVACALVDTSTGYQRPCGLKAAFR